MAFGLNATKTVSKGVSAYWFIAVSCGTGAIHFSHKAVNLAGEG
jgi:hypothetical protein